MKNKVSVIIPTYRRKQTVIRAIQSVLKQTYQDIEILIIDDNSDTVYSVYLTNYIKSLNNEKIIYLKNEKHKNGACARNFGIKRATGEYVAFLDDDDEWHPDKLTKQMKYINDNKIDGLSTYYSIYCENLLVKKCKKFNTRELLYKVFKREVSIYTSSLLFKKRSLIDINGFNEELIRHQDIQLMVDFLQDHTFDVLPEYLVNIHIDSDINKPDLKKTLKIKQDFFMVEKENLKKLSYTKQRDIIKAHYADIVKSALKERELKIAFKYIFKIGFSVNTYLYILKKLKGN